MLAAHDEPPLYLTLFDTMLRLPKAFAFSTPEEAALVTRRLRRPVAHSVIGVGVELLVVGGLGPVGRPAGQ